MLDVFFFLFFFFFIQYYIRWDNSFSPDQWLNSYTTLPLNYLITAYLTQLYYYLSLSIHIHECVFFSFLSDNRFNIYFLSKLCKWLLIFYFLLYFSLFSNFVSLLYFHFSIHPNPSFSFNLCHRCYHMEYNLFCVCLCIFSVPKIGVSLWFKLLYPTLCPMDTSFLHLSIKERERERVFVCVC